MSLFKTLDFANFLGGTPDEQKTFSDALVTELRNKGFVKLRNHGIPAAKIDQLFTTARSYFDLSLDEKMSGAHPKTPYPHRGYSEVGQEKIAGISGFEKGHLLNEPLGDVKETFDMGSSTDEDYPNIWPLSGYMPSFRAEMEYAFDRHHQCLIRVLESVALGLDLPKHHFMQLHSLREHELRLLHYPAIEADDLGPGSGKCRIAEHSDFGSLTFLMQDDVGGLYIEDQHHPRVFHHLESGPHEVILNVGDCLQRWTGGILRSANHKVTLPSSSNGQKRGLIIPERFSIAFFGKPNRSAVVQVLPQLRAEAPMDFPSITAGEYNMQKLVRTY